MALLSPRDIHEGHPLQPVKARASGFNNIDLGRMLNEIADIEAGKVASIVQRKPLTAESRVNTVRQDTNGNYIQ